MQNKLQGKARYKFDQGIWKLLCDDSHLLVVVKDEVQFATKFYFISLADGKEELGIVVPDSLKWNPYHFAFPYIFMEEFPDSDDPQQREAIVLKYENFSLQKVLHQETSFFWDEQGGLSLGNGQSISEVPSEFLRKKAVVFPGAISEEDKPFETIEKFLKKHLTIVPCKFCEYLEITDRIIISFYLCQREFMEQKIVVFSTKGEKLLEESLGKAENGISFESFFCMNNKLVVVDQQNSVLTYNLHEAY